MNSIAKGAGYALVGWLALAGLAGCGGDSSGADKFQSGAPQQPVGAQTTTPAVSTPLQAANGAPTISGSMPRVVAVGKPFVFTPTATDPDNDKLVFKISSRPGWATFDAQTGRITGTPKQADVGVHEDVVISVTDGKATVSLPTMDVTVEGPDPTAKVSANISWQPPTQNLDGSALVNLTGYKLYYGTQSQNYSKSVAIAGAGMTRFQVEDLTPGTYYFSITAITSSGTESNFSPEVSGEIS